MTKVSETPPSTRKIRALTGGFTLLELLVVIAVIGVLAVLLIAALNGTKRMAKRIQCMNNLKQFVAGDIAYFAENGELPPIETMVPSSIKVEHLTMMAKYLNMSVPPGPASSWPKRPNQPDWFNCPMAKNSGYAEGLTMGGGIYTGYLYVGGIEQSKMVTSGIASLTNPEHSAHKKNIRRGVMWADILGAFNSGDPRRFECFHVVTGAKYPDFRFQQSEIDGIHRAWSDGSVEWIPIGQLNLSGSESPDLQIKHILGNYYY